MTADRETFGPGLKSERERRGITLKAIADSTKIKESLFVELERSDLSKWPQGIFRRAHLCAYISAIGLPQQPTLGEFLRLFPEEEPGLDVNRARAEQPNDELKAAENTERPRAATTAESTGTEPALARVWAVVFDVAAVCMLSSILAGFAALNLWSTVALVCLSYSAVGTAWLGHSVGTHVQHRIQDLRQSSDQIQIASTSQSPLREVRFVAPPRKHATPPQRDVNREPAVQQRRASA